MTRQTLNSRSLVPNATAATKCINQCTVKPRHTQPPTNHVAESILRCFLHRDPRPAQSFCRQTLRSVAAVYAERQYQTRKLYRVQSQEALVHLYRLPVAISHRVARQVPCSLSSLHELRECARRRLCMLCTIMNCLPVPERPDRANDGERHGGRHSRDWHVRQPAFWACELLAEI